MKTLTIIASLSALLLVGCTESAGDKNLSYVDPTIGNISQLLVPTRPTVQRPNQMIRMFPMRNDHLDDRISIFPLNMSSHRGGATFGIMPFTTAPESGREPVGIWDQELEITRPYYYKTWLENYDVQVEFAPGRKSGYYKIDFPASADRNLYIKLMSKTGGSLTYADGVVEGVEPMRSKMQAYLYGTFNVRPESFTADGRHGVFTWKPETSASTVEFTYAISYISAEQAKANLSAEITNKDFATMTAEAKKSWADVMGQIEVEGGSDAYKRTFYSALYRTYERMIDITEDGKYFSGYDFTVHDDGDGRPFYNDDWSWDSYVAHHPLRNILQPSVESDMLNSYVKMYEQSGWMPRFPSVSGDAAVMNSFHISISFLDAWNKGVRNFDMEKAYEGLHKRMTRTSILPWRNIPAMALDSIYRERGFFPALHPGEEEVYAEVDDWESRQAVAVTLGDSYDSWAMAKLATELGKDADAKMFTRRSGNYKNLFHPGHGMFMPRDADGNWVDINPKLDGGPGGRDYYDENNGWTYMWQVQFDVPALMELQGGKQKFEDRLDQLYREDLGVPNRWQMISTWPDMTGNIGQFSVGNEPSFHIPYLYNFTDSPWKTQKKIRTVLNTWFKDNVFGIPGDEDGGGMTAFVVLSAMGFYPVTAGVPVYTIGSPLFEKVTIHLENGRDFTVVARGNSDVNKYIQSATLNGKTLNTPWFTHDDILGGGTLEFEMGAYPNKDWGTDPFAY